MSWLSSIYSTNIEITSEEFEIGLPLIETSLVEVYLVVEPQVCKPGRSLIARSIQD